MILTARFCAILGAGLIVLAGCSTAPTQFPSNRPLKYIHGFRVNPENTVRYCTKMSEQRGEKNLRRLTETAQFEEVWVYIPKIKEWHEIGINERAEIVDEKDPRYKKKGVDFEGEYLHAIATTFKEFTLYHIHNLKRRVDSDVMFYQPECSLPSYDDLCIDLKVQISYYQLNEGHSIRFKSVSPAGVTEIKFSQYARDHFQDLDAEEAAIKGDLDKFQNFDYYKPAHFSTFNSSIDIAYEPLLMRSEPDPSPPHLQTPVRPPLGTGHPNVPR